MGKGSKAVPAWANSTVVTKYLYKTVRMLKNEGLKQTVFAAKYVVGRYLKLKAIKKEFYLTKELRDEQERTVFPYMPKISIIVPVYNTDPKFLREMLDLYYKQELYAQNQHHSSCL